MSTTHPTSLYLPAGEVDKRILEAGNDVRAEVRNSVDQLKLKIDEIAESMTLLTGNQTTKGVLSRIEDVLRDNQNALVDLKSDVEEIRGDIASRKTDDADFQKKIRAEVDDLRRKVDAIQILIRAMSFVWRIFAALSTATNTIAAGKSPRMTWAILFGILWIAAVQFAHLVLPALRFAVLKRTLTF